MTEYHFQNFCENIKRDGYIYYPVSVNEISQLVQSAAAQNKIIRAVGSSHCTPPVVTSTDETHDFVSLRDFLLDGEQCVVDEVNMKVSVNAGWTGATLYNKINNYNGKRYYLPTQPSLSSFTLAGFTSVSVNGGTLGESIMSDYLTAIEYVDGNGNFITRSDADEDFDMYRILLGAGGILTKLTFKIINIENLEIKSDFVSGTILGPDGKFNPNVLNPYLQESLDHALNPQYYMQRHSFFDIHNNIWIQLEWKESDQNKLTVNIPEAQTLIKLPTDLILSNTLPDYRSDKLLIKTISLAYSQLIADSVKLNSLDASQYWVYGGTRVYFMSYYVPIYDEITGNSFENIYSGFNKIIELRDKYPNFDVDVPFDLRLVKSTSKCKVSPIYSPTTKVYAAIEVICQATNIHLEGDIYSDLIGPNKILYKDIVKRLNDQFEGFMYDIEQHWISLGSKVHFGKMSLFGYNSNGEIRPHNETMIRNILPSNVKSILNSRTFPVFKNKWTNDMLYLP